MTFDTEGAQPPTMLTGPTATLELMRGVSDAVAIKDQTLAGGLSPPAGCPHEVSLGGLLRALGSLIDNVALSFILFIIEIWTPVIRVLSDEQN